MVQVGTIVWLASELMFFAGLFAIYFTIRAVRPDLWETEPEKLNIPFSFANTINLVLSSVWCQMGVFAAERFQPRRSEPSGPPGPGHGWKNWGMREWYVVTYIVGAPLRRRPGVRVRQARRRGPDAIAPAPTARSST